MLHPAAPGRTRLNIAGVHHFLLRLHPAAPGRTCLSIAGVHHFLLMLHPAAPGRTRTRLSIAGGPPFAPKAAPGCTWTLPAAPCSNFFLRLRIWLAAAGWWVGWQLLWLVNMQTHVHTCTCFCYVFPMAPACTLSAPASIVAQTYRCLYVLLQIQKVAPGCTRSAPAGNLQKLYVFICFNAIASSTPSPLYNTN